MTGPSEFRSLALLYSPALLQSESADDFHSLSDAVQQQLMPHEYIEHIWVSDLITGEWEKQRLRRFKMLICQSAVRRAIYNLLKLLFGVAESKEAADLAQRWFTNKSVRRKVLAILRDFGLDESAIDAEAFRLSMEDLAAIDGRLAELEARCDKNLRRLEDHRAGLASQIQPNSDQCVHGDPTLSPGA